MTDIPRGPEHIPLQNRISTLPIVILIIDVKSKRKIREERIDFSDKEARGWLGKLSAWAFTNGYKLETCAESDYVVEL